MDATKQVGRTDDRNQQIRAEARSFVKAAFNAAMAYAVGMPMGKHTVPGFQSVTVEAYAEEIEGRYIDSTEYEAGHIEMHSTGRVLLEVDFGPCVQSEDIDAMLNDGATIDWEKVGSTTITVDSLSAGRSWDWQPLQVIDNSKYDPFAETAEVRA